ncbi:hypothetical protein ES705_43235 [subsurface metagenome]
MLDLAIQDVICFQTYRIEIILGFKKTVDLRIGKRRIATKIPDEVLVPITFHHRLQNAFPVIGAIDIALAK